MNKDVVTSTEKLIGVGKVTVEEACRWRGWYDGVFVFWVYRNGKLNYRESSKASVGYWYGTVIMLSLSVVWNCELNIGIPGRRFPVVKFSVCAVQFVKINPLLISKLIIQGSEFLHWTVFCGNYIAVWGWPNYTFRNTTEVQMHPNCTSRNTTAVYIHPNYTFGIPSKFTCIRTRLFGIPPQLTSSYTTTKKPITFPCETLNCVRQ